MVNEVRREIERIRGYISNGRLTQFDEANTKATAIEPILRELGWNVVDPDEVRREYSVGSRSVDYALFCDDTLKVFIEAKRGGELLERHQEQLLDYAFAEGVEIAILTNGATWWFYLPIRAVSWERRKVATVELDRQDSTEIAQKLADLLGKENVESGAAIQKAERHQISEILPTVWNKLVSEPDNSIVNLLAERTHRLCVRQPDRNEVEQFLSGHLEQIQITPLLTTPVPPSEPNAPPEPKPSRSLKLTKATAFTFDGRRYEVQSWREMFVRLCEVIHEIHGNRFEEVLSFKGKIKSPFSRNASDFTAPKQINGTDIFVETSGGSEVIKRRAENLIANFGYDKDDLSYESRIL